MGGKEHGELSFSLWYEASYSYIMHIDTENGIRWIERLGSLG
jgi:hypothetical protein